MTDAGDEDGERARSTLWQRVKTAVALLDDHDSDDDDADLEFAMSIGLVLALIPRLDAAKGANEEQERLRKQMRKSLAEMRDMLVEAHDDRYEVLASGGERLFEARLVLYSNVQMSPDVLPVLRTDGGTAAVAVQYARAVGIYRFLARAFRVKPNDEALRRALPPPTIVRAVDAGLSHLESTWRQANDATYFDAAAPTLRDLFELAFGTWDAPPGAARGRRRAS